MTNPRHHALHLLASSCHVRCDNLADQIGSGPRHARGVAELCVIGTFP
jgi:hypothetical protein